MDVIINVILILDAWKKLLQKTRKKETTEMEMKNDRYSVMIEKA